MSLLCVFAHLVRHMEAECETLVINAPVFFMDTQSFLSYTGGIFWIVITTAVTSSWNVTFSVIKHPYLSPLMLLFSINYSFSGR